MSILSSSGMYLSLDFASLFDLNFDVGFAAYFGSFPLVNRLVMWEQRARALEGIKA